MAYLYHRRKNRYKRLPTHNSPYVTTNPVCSADNDWDTQMPNTEAPVGYRNPLHNELHNLEPENVDQTATLLDNDPLAAGHHEAS